MKILVSACLVGENVKYSGGNNLSEKLLRYIDEYKAEVITVCPEVLGGLTIPRAPGEIVDGVVRNADGTSVDFEYRSGAAKALAIAEKEQPDLVVLQSRSPSCGVNEIYDGSFSGVKIPGHGVFADLMIKNGFNVVDIEEMR